MMLAMKNLLLGNLTSANANGPDSENKPKGGFGALFAKYK
jgi:hypothetical protein